MWPSKADLCASSTIRVDSTIFDFGISLLSPPLVAPAVVISFLTEPDYQFLREREAFSPTTGSECLSKDPTAVEYVLTRVFI